MLKVENRIKVLEGVRPDAIPDEVLQSTEPVLLRGLVDSWPIVAAAKQSSRAAIEYVRSFYQGATVGIFFADAKSGGR